MSPLIAVPTKDEMDAMDDEPTKRIASRDPMFGKDEKVALLRNAVEAMSVARSRFVR
ncbi:hypothetical protein [Nocardia sp. NPDC059239]|uniref:hypothetical protein n=1 Tax=Actinomycetes TaxID=1760 RepID=UPI0036BDE589